METWRVIKNFPNYSVSNFGNIINNKSNKLMKLCIKGGYYTVSLIGIIKEKLLKFTGLLLLNL